jgi:O-antigen ligase/tetratricopeptide (TPR) repeat protein
MRGIVLPRTPLEWLAVSAGLAVFGYLGWDGALWDAGSQLLLHLVAAGAIGGLGVLAVSGAALPRTSIDVPILLLVAAFAAATVSALNVGMSLRAMSVVVAYAAMLPVALVAIRHRPAWVGIVTAVPVLLLSIPSLLELLGRRAEWILAGAPGLPPLRLRGEDTPFGSVAVPPFVIIPAWALAGLIEPAWLRRTVRGGLVIVGIPMTILSGSRSAWLAIAAAVLVGVAPLLWRRRDRLRLVRRPGGRELLIGAGAVALVVLGIALVVPRLTAVTSLLYRAALWRDTLAAWATDPLLGIGPGFMPYARQAAAADFTFPVRQPHSHNLPLGVLGDAGLVGLAAAAVLVVALIVVAGPWRCRTRVGRTASIVLVGLGVGGLFEDLTFVPGFVLLAIALVAVVLLDVDAVRWERPVLGPRAGPARIAAAATGALAALALVAATVTADASGLAHRAGVMSGADEGWDDAADWLSRAVAIDPWHPAPPAALAVAAEAAGRGDEAREAAERAVALNPGDAVSWTNLSLICRALDDEACQTRAAERVTATARYGAAELVNAAASLANAGDEAAADGAYRQSLLTQPLTAFVLYWSRPIDIGDGRIADYADRSWELNRLVALHATGGPIRPDEYADPGVRALAHAALGERVEAESALARAIESTPGETSTWDLVVVLRAAWGEPIDEELRIARVVRGSAFPEPDAERGIPRRVLDIGSFRAFPADGYVRNAVRLGTSPPYPWILGRLLP